MTDQRQALVTHLTHASWYQVLALRAAHHLARGAQQTKAALIAELAHHLLQPTTVATSIAQLDLIGKDALRALLAADGALPVHTFEQRFGPIRPYRPWRKDDPDKAAQPWLAPISTTERLWYLGLIYRDPPKPRPGRRQHYVLPAELIPLLTAQVAPVAQEPAAFTPQPRPGRPADLLYHLGLWLASLAAEPVTPLHGRWLPPRLVAALAQRTGLDQAADFQPQRSERYLPYLAFLHYLAEAAELVAAGDVLTITPQGWQWLGAPPDERRRALWAALLAAATNLAQPYRFAWQPLSPQARQFLCPALRHLPLDRFLPLPALLHQWRLQDADGRLPDPYTPFRGLAETDDDDASEAHAIDPVACFCREPLFWLGLIDVAHPVDPTAPAEPAIRLTPIGAWLLREEAWRAPDAVTAHATIPKGSPDTILLPVHAQPLHLARLAPLCRWEAPTADHAPPLEIAQALTLEGARIGQAVARDTPPAQILQHLAAALGRPPSRRLRQRIQRWADQGQQVRLLPMLVAETQSPALLTTLQRYQLVRRRTVATLGPRHFAVDPQQAPGLVQTLQHLGYYLVAPPGTGDAAAIDGAEPGDANLHPGFQWLLLQLYRGLGAYVDLPVKLPWDGGRTLAARLTPMQRAAAESAAATILADLQAGLDGYLRLPAWQMEQFPTAATLAALQQALAERHDVELRYWSVSSGGPTVRRVTPQRLEEQAGIPYLHAYCHLRQTERVFRVDRIETVEVVVGS